MPRQQVLLSKHFHVASGCRQKSSLRNSGVAGGGPNLIMWFMSPSGEGWDQGLDEQEGSDSDDDGWDMVPATRVDMDWPLSTRVRVNTVLRRGPSSGGKKQSLSDLLLLLTTSYVSFSHALSLRSLKYHPKGRRKATNKTFFVAPNVWWPRAVTYFTA